LLPRHDDVDIVATSQAVVRHGKERVGVWRQVDSDDLRFLVDDVVDETRVLVAKAIVVLPPNMGGEEVVEGRDGTPPRDLPGRLEPLRVLVEHGVDDVDERLVAREKAVAAREE